MEKAKTNSNTSITGDFDVDVKLNRQGTLHLKAYSHTDEKITYNATETVQGVGVSYQETFDTFRELFRKYLAIFKRKNDRQPPCNPLIISNDFHFLTFHSQFSTLYHCFLIFFRQIVLVT